MKKLLSLALAAVLLLSCLPLSAVAEGGADPTGTTDPTVATDPTGSTESTVSTEAVPLADDSDHTTTFTHPKKSVYLVGESLDLTGAALEVSDGENTHVIDLTTVTISGFDSAKVGEQDVLITFYDPILESDSNLSFRVTVVAESTLQNIEVTTMPTKTVYNVGDTLDVSGGMLTLYYDTHEETIPLTSDMVTGFDSSKAGPLKLNVIYENFSTTFSVQVNRPVVVRSIHVPYDSGMRTSYLVGDTLDLSTGALRVSYSDNSSKTVPLSDPDVTVTGFDSSKVARLELTITYQGQECTEFVYIGALSGKCGDNLTFAFDKTTGTLNIQGSGAMYDFHWVTNITPWYAYADQIKKVVLPTGITELGNCAFDGCVNLTQINLPEGLTCLGEFGFNLCHSLASVTLPSTLKTIDAYAFSDCIALETLVIPEGVTSIGDYAFAGAINLANLTVPKSLKVIGNVAFMNCPKLEQLPLPEDSQLESIRSLAFVDTGLKEFTVPATVTEIAYQAFVNTQLERITFLGNAPFLNQSPYSETNDIFASYFGTSRNISAFYPGGDDTWTAQVQERYGAVRQEYIAPNITWIPTFGVADNDSGFDPEADGLDKVLEEVLKEYDSAENPSVQLAISNVDRSELTEEVLDAMEEAAEDKNIEFMDISLNLVLDNVPTNLGSQNNHIIVITLNYDSLGKQNMVVYRYHNGKVDTLTQSPNSDGEFIEVKNGKLIIHAKKFSPYAVGFDPIPVVRFDTGEGSEVAPLEVEAGNKITQPADPTREHYIFRGWYSDEACTDAWDFTADTVSADITLYAKWEKLMTVTFNTNGGSTVAALDVESGSKLTAPTAPTKDHAVFQGWFKDEALTTQWNFTGDTVTADITLYAKWATGYEVTFNSMQGTMVATQAVVPNGKVTKPADPTRTNYRFQGWYSDEACTTPWNFTTGTVTQDITLYAKWAPDFLTGITVTPAEADVVQGNNLTLQAQVSIAQGSTAIVSWSVAGAKNTGTKISTAGVLTVDEEETAAVLVVTATAICGTELETDTAEITVIPYYEILSGSGKRWNQNSTTNLEFIADGPFGKLEDILIDGKSVGVTYASTDAKGTKVTLKPDYLKKLSLGNHTITLVYEDGGEASGTFTIQKATSSANTGDGFRPILLACLMTASAAALAALLILRRKRM